MNTRELINRIIDLALEEDGYDVTANAIFSETDRLEAVFTAKSSGVIAGLDVAETVFKRLDDTAIFEKKVCDGDRVDNGTVLASITGNAGKLLKAERVALNFMQRMSGIATMTAMFVRELEGTKDCTAGYEKDRSRPEASG